MNESYISNPFYFGSSYGGFYAGWYGGALIGITPFLREIQVNFAAKNLKPGSIGNIFFDDIKVNNFTQRASEINVASSVAFSSIKQNQGVYGASSYAYAEVIGTSISDTQNILHIDDNFLTLLVRKDPADPIADFVSTTDFQVDELVYQTSNGLKQNFQYNGALYPSTTFVGTVKKWIRLSNDQGLLFVKPEIGRVNAVVGLASSNLWNWTSGTNKLRNAIRIDANNRFAAGETLRYAENDAFLVNVASVNAYTAYSSVVSAANVANPKSLVLSTNNPSRDGIGNIVGNTIYIVDGTNTGFKSVVRSISTNTQFGWTEANLFDSIPNVPDNTTTYSFGDHTVNDIGAMYGIFHIPSYQNIRWLTGERLFTITDTPTYNDNGYNMRAIAKFTSIGWWNTTENARSDVIRDLTPNTLRIAPNATVLSQKINDRKFMSQTFFTPKGNEIVDGVIKNAHGVFVTSVDLYFKSKPTDSQELFPFTLAITKVVDGLPSNEIIAEKTLEPAYITTSATAPAFGSSTATKFTFQDPVYLLPSTEYAIQLITESPDYEVWTAIMGDEYVDVNGNTRRMSEQPYVGNFFKSQNASQWTPILNQDLMFVINRASFSKTPSTVYFNLVKDAETRRNIFMDAVKLTATEQQFAPTNIKYELTSYLTDETPTTVDLINNEYYSFGKDTTVSSVTSKRRRLIKAASNDVSLNVKVTLSTTDDTVSPVINRERMGVIAIQNIVNNAGIANNLITVINGGNHISAANITVTISNPDVGLSVATANVLPSMLSGNTITGINIINAGAGYFTTPTITISEPGAVQNASAVINGETDSTGGNILAKYQTKVVTLKDGFDSGDLVVRLQAIKPQGTDVAVYFKVLSAADSDQFVSKTWQKMVPVTDITSADQSTLVSLEYRYNLNSGRISYFDGKRAMPLNGTFKYFAIKVRLTAADPTVVPYVETMTVLAVPGDDPENNLDGGFFSGTGGT